LTDDGPLAESPDEVGKAIAASIPATRFAWWLYFNDANVFGYCASDEAQFDWDE